MRTLPLPWREREAGVGSGTCTFPNTVCGVGPLRKMLRTVTPSGPPRGGEAGAPLSTFISTSPRSSSSKPPNSSSTALVSEDRWIFRAE